MRDWRMVICPERDGRGVMGRSFGLLRPILCNPSYTGCLEEEDTENLQKSLASIPATPG